jgi:hypothetical protein
MTYKEATAFRKAANAPLDWEETNNLPALPLDRVEFTRRIVDVMRGYKKSLDSWDASTKRADIQNKGVLDSLRTYLRFSVHPNIFMKLLSPPTTNDDDSHVNIIQYISQDYPQTLGNIIEILETKYEDLWGKCYTHGVSDNARQNVLDTLYEMIQERSAKNSGNFSENLTVSNCLPQPMTVLYTKYWKSDDYYKIANVQTIEEINNIELRFLGIESSFLGIPSHSLDNVATAFLTLVLTVVYIALFSVSWQLIVFLPIALLLSLNICFSMNKIVWKNPNMTLGQLADKIVALHCEGYIRMTGENP